MIAMAAALSLFDYPLRVPSLMLVVTIAAVWMARATVPQRTPAGI